MMGLDISWSSFHIVEVMSQAWFGHKRIGYLGAALSFAPTTEVILLTTHLFRKSFTQTGLSENSEITEGKQYETGAALTCLSNIVTPDLAQDLLSVCQRRCVGCCVALFVCFCFLFAFLLLMLLL